MHPFVLKINEYFINYYKFETLHSILNIYDYYFIYTYVTIFTFRIIILLHRHETISMLTLEFTILGQYTSSSGYERYLLIYYNGSFN